MAQMSKGFNDDPFWQHVDEVLAENEAIMASKIRRPGEIGSVACRPTLLDATDPEQPLLPDLPPEAA